CAAQLQQPAASGTAPNPLTDMQFLHRSAEREKRPLRHRQIEPQMPPRRQSPGGNGKMTNNSVIREKRGQAFWITINRPEKRNALNGEVIAGIAQGYREAHEDKDVRVIVLTGAGDRAFCAGADLENSGAAFARDFSKPNADYADLLRQSQNATKPAI